MLKSYINLKEMFNLIISKYYFTIWTSFTLHFGQKTLYNLDKNCYIFWAKFTLQFG